MQIKVLKPGLLTSIQDLGRSGYRDAGVPVSGAMDTFAARIANVLVGNSVEAPVLEFTYGDVHLKAETDLLIAHCGGGSELVIDKLVVASWKPVYVCAGTSVWLKNSTEGCRSYLAIAGGWTATRILNSYSTYLPLGIGGVNGGNPKKGDLLTSEVDLSVISWSLLANLQRPSKAKPGTCFFSLNWGVHPASMITYRNREIRVIVGHEYDWFAHEMQERFFEQEFVISAESDRMGYRLEGEVLAITENKQLLSTAVVPGTIQVTAGGSLIILMADCQTTGGYPRIAQVAAIDLPVCAQLKPGDSIRFRQVTMQDAEDLLSQLEASIRDVQALITRKYISNENAHTFKM